MPVGAWVALSTAATNQLAVNSRCVMQFGADHVHSAEVDNLVGKLNVGSTTGHVGCNRHPVLLACVGDDVGFLLDIVGVENLVRDPEFR